MAGLFKDYVTPKDLSFEVDGIIRRLLSLESVILEKERHTMGLISDDEYREWLRRKDQMVWGDIFKTNKEAK